MLPSELVHILACPICKGELIQKEDGSSLRCDPCGAVYPIVEGIPALLPAQATSATPATCGVP